jgi:hypothetical protein
MSFFSSFSLIYFDGKIWTNQITSHMLEIYCYYDLLSWLIGIFNLSLKSFPYTILTSPFSF